MGIIVYFLNKESFKMPFYTKASYLLILSTPTEYLDVLFILFYSKHSGANLLIVQKGNIHLPKTMQYY